MNLSLIKIKGPGAYFTRKRFILLLFVFFIGLAAAGSMALTEFQIFDAFTAIPRVVVWIIKNLVPDSKAFSRLPRIMDKLVETVLVAIVSSVTAAICAVFFGIMGSRTTNSVRFLIILSRAIASLNRNIPVVAWAMIFLLTFGQSGFTGFLALFFAAFGFLVRAFIETIDEASSQPVRALRAAGARYIHIIFQAVIPSALPQMMSWVLYMIETNIRDATLVGLLTGSGIGFMFSIYYKSLQYSSASLVVLCIVIVVLVIETLSNRLRRIIL